MRRKKHNILWIVLLIFMGIGIGYALIATDLKVVGTAGLKGGTWNVYFDNIGGTVSSGSRVIDIPTVDPNDNTKISYHIALDTPGAYAILRLDAINGGTVDAMIRYGNVKINGSEDIPEYLQIDGYYDDGIWAREYQILPAGSTHTLEIILKYRDDIPESVMPTEDQSLYVVLDFEYSQKNKYAVPRTQTRYLVHNYREDKIMLHIEDSLLSPHVTSYDNYQDAIEEDGGHDTFLKLTYAGRYIQFIDVGFIVENTAYYVRGGSPDYFASNKDVLMPFSNDYTCYEYDDNHYYRCVFPNEMVTIRDNGDVSITETENGSNNLTCGMDTDDNYAFCTK